MYTHIEASVFVRDDPGGCSETTTVHPTYLAGSADSSIGSEWANKKEYINLTYPDNMRSKELGVSNVNLNKNL